jgi:hypothetical protein
VLVVKARPGYDPRASRVEVDASYNDSLSSIGQLPTDAKKSMAEDKKRIRRSEEKLIADLEARIASLKARAARKEARANPAIRHTAAALKSIDKAMATTDDSALRRALDDARSTLSACLSLNGVVVTQTNFASPRGGRRSSSNVEEMGETLLAYVRSNPGQRGEQIAAALGTDTKTMRLPMKKLIAERKIKTKGERRGMSYHIA